MASQGEPRVEQLFVDVAVLKSRSEDIRDGIARLETSVTEVRLRMDNFVTRREWEALGGRRDERLDGLEKAMNRQEVKSARLTGALSVVSALAILALGAAGHLAHLLP